MSPSNLTRKEALDLVTPVIDGEVNKKTVSDFYSVLDQYREVRRQFESERKIKKLLFERLPREKAPLRLRDRISDFLEHVRQTDEDAHNPTDDKQIFSLNGYGSSISGIGFSNLNETDFESDNDDKPTNCSNSEECLENLASVFFNKHLKVARIHQNHLLRIQPEFRPTSSFDIPKITGASFLGFLWVEPVAGFKVPVLRYFVSAEDQLVYVFVFDLIEILKFDNLMPHQDAYRACRHPMCGQVVEAQGNQLVSWKWENYWYIAVSNFSGRKLASLIDPLHKRLT